MNQRKTVNLATLAFVEEATYVPGIGGLQRWTRDLAELLERKGHDVVVYQKSSSAFTRRYSDYIEVIGLEAPASFYGNFLFSKRLTKRIRKSDPVLFVSQELMIGADWAGCLSVNHGIWWDSDFPFMKRWLNKWIQAHIIMASSVVVCVDTNYINWCHAEIPNRFGWREKMRYLPNYADTGQFCYRSESAPKQSYFKILCPRRMPDSLSNRWDGRGALLLLEALAILEQRNFPFVAEFAGSGKAKADVVSYAVSHGFGDRILCSEYQLDEIPEVYARSDIVVIPTASREGTSLAAVEAMCSGCATVVTHVGGLPNLVIDGLNGFMCDLSPLALADAIVRASAYCRDVQWKMSSAELSRRAFGKQVWEEKLSAYLDSALGGS